MTPPFRCLKKKANVAQKATNDRKKYSMISLSSRDKFTQNEDLKQLLLATGDLGLEEGNTWHDTFWGVDAKTREGENHLGRILMRVREELAEL